MSDFVTKTSCQFNLVSAKLDLQTITNDLCPWGADGQIGLRHRLGCNNQWKDAIGGLYDRVTNTQLASESDFTEWNTLVPAYLKLMLEKLATAEHVKWGRVRLMKLMPKTGLSMHFDTEPRYHAVLTTNENAIISQCYKNAGMLRAVGYHIPADEYWYKIDTTVEHFVFNGGWEPRIHLVACPVN